MANNYILLGSTVLASPSSSIVFSDIPQTYKDLVLHISMRATSANNVTIRYNSNNTNYSYTMYRGEATPSYEGSASASGYFIGTPNNSGFASNYFNYYRVYITDYASTTRYKSCHFIGTEMDNSIFENRIGSALWSNTSAITSIGMTLEELVAGTSVRLYGILA